MSKEKYIYESPDGGKTVYSRKIGDTVNKRKLVARKSTVGVDPSGSVTVTSAIDEENYNETIGGVPILSATEDIGWNDNYAFAPNSAHVFESEEQQMINDIRAELDLINKRLAILEPNFELNEKFQSLKDLYNEYKAMEKLLTGPDRNEED